MSLAWHHKVRRDISIHLGGDVVQVDGDGRLVGNSDKFDEVLIKHPLWVQKEVAKPQPKAAKKKKRQQNG